MCVCLTDTVDRPDTHAYNHMFLKIVNLPAGGAGLSPHYWYCVLVDSMAGLSLSSGYSRTRARNTKNHHDQTEKDSSLTQKSSLTYSSKITNTTSRHFIKIKM